MFGKMSGMLQKLKEVQEKTEELKAQLDKEMLHKRTTDGLLEIKISLTQRIEEIKISDDLMKDKTQLEDYLILVLNKLTAQAKTSYEEQMTIIAKEGLPEIPGLS